MFRCYNGEWDDDAKALFAKQDGLLAEIQAVEPNAHCTYFPVTGQFQVHVWGRPLSDMRYSKLDALRDAKCKMEKASGGQG